MKDEVKRPPLPRAYILLYIIFKKYHAKEKNLWKNNDLTDNTRGIPPCGKMPERWMPERID
jgi:hypothetical protein